jgi:hypothetical protein
MISRTSHLFIAKAKGLKIKVGYAANEINAMSNGKRTKINTRITVACSSALSA